MSPSKETIAVRLEDSSRTDLNEELHECVGVKTPHVYGEDSRWVNPPHVAKGINFLANRKGVNRGLVTRCDECHALFKQSPEVILAAYDPDDTRVPEYLPKKPYQQVPEVIDVPYETGTLTSTPPWKA